MSTYATRPLTADEILKMVNADARIVQGKAETQAQQNAYLGNFQEIVRKAMVQLGLIPEGYQDRYGVVNDEVRGLANANTQAGLSRSADLMNARRLAERRLKRQLAARGALRSGELRFGLEGLDLDSRKRRQSLLDDFFNQ